MGVNSLPKTVTRQRRDCDLNQGPSGSESSTLTTRLPSHPAIFRFREDLQRMLGCKSCVHWPTTSKHGCLGRGVYAREDEWLVAAGEVVVELSNGMPNCTTSRK